MLSCWSKSDTGLDPSRAMNHPEEPQDHWGRLAEEFGLEPAQEAKRAPRPADRDTPPPSRPAPVDRPGITIKPKAPAPEARETERRSDPETSFGAWVEPEPAPRARAQRVEEPTAVPPALEGERDSAAPLEEEEKR